MKIHIRLFATLRAGRFARGEIEIPPGGALVDVLSRLKIDRPEVAIRLVNGQAADWTQPLVEGDTVSLFPAIGGG
jgi:molybdopterin converting factor small subunit